MIEHFVQVPLRQRMELGLGHNFAPSIVKVGAMTNKTKQRLHKVRVLCLSGNVAGALAACGLPQAEDVLAVHDFIVARPKQFLALLRAQRHGFVVVVTKDLRYQRFRTIWKLSAVAAGMWHWTFADEEGRTDPFRWGRLLAVEIPQLIAEVFLSLWTLGTGWVRLVRYRRLCR